MVVGVLNRWKGGNKNGRWFCVPGLPQRYLGCLKKEAVK